MAVDREQFASNGILNSRSGAVKKNMEQVSSDGIINERQALAESNIFEDGYFWENTFEFVCVKYRMMAWNLNTLDWESWVADNEPNTNNPSGDPKKDVMIIDIW